MWSWSLLEPVTECPESASSYLQCHSWELNGLDLQWTHYITNNVELPPHDFLLIVLRLQRPFKAVMSP